MNLSAERARKFFSRLPRAVAPARRALVSLLYPPRCENCDARVAPPLYLCEGCAAEAVRIRAPFCAVCSEPFHGQIDGRFTCPNCLDRKFHFSAAVSPYRAGGIVREFIHRFKYHGEFQLRHPLASWAAEGLADARIRQSRVDALVPVPLSSARRRHRGFNQAAEIAALVSKSAGLRMAESLRRTRDTPTQVRLDRRQRMENLRNAFEVRQSADVRGLHLILVDDVLTTGSTLDECARALLKGGAASVRALTVARG